MAGPFVDQGPASTTRPAALALSYPIPLLHPLNATALESLTNSSGFIGGRSSGYALPPTPGEPAAGAAGSANTTPMGTATGRIEDSLTDLPISGALVLPLPIGATCPNQTCPPVYTDASGSFTVNVLPGSDQISVNAGYYVDNYTVLTNVTAGGSYPLGTLYLVPDAVVCGVVEGNDSQHEVVPGVVVGGASRDSRIGAGPEAITDSKGLFRVAVPPGASAISFVPYRNWGLYFGTSLFVDYTPGEGFGHCIDLGVVLLRVGVRVTVTPYDRVTQRPITTGGLWALQACARDSQLVCFAQGTRQPVGKPAYAVAPVGADTLRVMMTGYMLNLTNVDVPREPPGRTLDLGRIYLLPEIGAVAWTNLTWGATVGPAVSKWGTGWVVGSSCSLDGYSFSTVPLGSPNMTWSTCTPFGCLPIHTEMGLGLAPLRNSVHVFPDTGGFCYPAPPMWPIPSRLPVSDNWTWVNATEGHTYNLHGLDFTPGTYVEGQVVPDRLPWSISACSTDALSVCWPASSNLSISWVPGCPTAAAMTATGVFCVAVPPGPFVLKLQSQTGSMNVTWGYNPPGVWNQLPLLLPHASRVNISTLRLTDSILRGRILSCVGGQPINDTIVPIRVGSAGLGAAPAVQTTATTGGYFRTYAPVGWDSLQVRAPNYVSNRTWVDVGNGTQDLGTIYLCPESFIVGSVLGSNGYALNTSSASICDLATTVCTPISIGSGLTNTNGSYYVLAEAGHLPIGAYEIVANAPGYLSNSTWVNLTSPGVTVHAPTIYLDPILGGSPRPPARAIFDRAAAAPATAPAAAWIYGRVADNATGEGLPDSTIAITPEGGGATVLLSSQFTIDGRFNFSQSLGTYWMNFTEAGYYDLRSYFVYVNGTTPSVDLGEVRLVGLPQLAGRAVIDPWRQNVSYGEGVAPQALVRVCTASQTVCGAAGKTDSGGFFNVSAPVGRYDRIFVDATGGGIGTAAPGFLANSTRWNVSANATGPDRTTLVIGETIFATYTGIVRDASTDNLTPVRWGSLAISSLTPTYGSSSTTEQLTGAGGYTVFLGPGNITAALFQGSAWVPRTLTLTFPYSLNQTLNTTPSRLNVLPVASLEHFGWVEFNVTGVPPPYGAPSNRVRFPTATAGVFTKNATGIYSVPTVGDGWGYVNMTAPPGPNVTVTISAGDFNSTTVRNISVNQSATTQLGRGSLANTSVVPWGWIGGVVRDPAVNGGVPGASVLLVDNASFSGSPEEVSNYVGTYFSDMPVGNPVQLAVNRPGYLGNDSLVYAHPGQRLNQTVNLTGRGVVAGRVIGFPGSNPLYQAAVSVCPTINPECFSSNATTNGSGYFWVLADPGTDVISISLPHYALNGSADYLQVRPDAWEWAGTFVMNQYATVGGVVLGDPSGQPLAGANASVCSDLALPGQPTGPCFETVQTDSFGRFTVSTPPGNYIVAINATDYNATYYPISLSAGESVDLGTVLLQQYGTLTGTVLGSDTDAPVAGTLVRACPLWLAGNCTSLVPVTGAGRYLLTGPPGGYLVTASSPGYQDSYGRATMASGEVTDVPTLFLVPVGTDLLYSVSGTVTAGTISAPLPGAIVSAGPNFATSTDAHGQYQLLLPWGDYRVSARSNGYTTESRQLMVHQNLTAVDFVLPVAVYTLSGTTRDGLTGDLVPNVQFYLAGTLIATSDPFGTYTMSLANGSYALTTRAQGSFSTIYAPVTFAVYIQSGSQTRNVQLFPVRALGYGVVVNRLTGAPVPNATIVIAGATQDSYPERGIYHTDVLGTFVAPLYIGNYGINATAPGYLPVAQSQKITSNATVPITLSMTPVSSGATGAGGGMGLTPILVVVGVAAAAVVAFVGLGRLRTSSPPMGRPAAGEKSP